MAMVQTTQKVSFLPFHTNRDAEALLVRLHEVDDGCEAWRRQPSNLSTFVFRIDF